MIEVVYTPKTPEEANRRVARAKQFLGKPFLRINPPRAPHIVLFTASNGQKVRIGNVEQIYNDMLLMDAISNNGQDGPLFESTCNDFELQILNAAKRLMGGATWDDPFGTLAFSYRKTPCEHGWITDGENHKCPECAKA